MKLRQSKWLLLKTVVFILSLLPAGFLLWNAYNDTLGANPVEAIHFTLGDWALRFLCLTLALSPYRYITGQNWVNRFRRMFGLYAFFYASLHVFVFVALDISFRWDYFLKELAESDYILFGLIAFLIMLPLAMTSPRFMQKALGKMWKKIHAWVYLAAVTAGIHYLLLVKSDVAQPVFYLLVIILLLGFRLARWLKKPLFGWRIMQKKGSKV